MNKKKSILVFMPYRKYLSRDTNLEILKEWINFEHDIIDKYHRYVGWIQEEEEQYW